MEYMYESVTMKPIILGSEYKLIYVCIYTY